MSWVCEDCKEIKLEDDDFYCPKCKPNHNKKPDITPKKNKSAIKDTITSVVAACGFALLMYILIMLLIYYTLFHPRDKWEHK